MADDHDTSPMHSSDSDVFRSVEQNRTEQNASKFQIAKPAREHECV